MDTSVLLLLHHVGDCTGSCQHDQCANVEQAVAAAEVWLLSDISSPAVCFGWARTVVAAAARARLVRAFSVDAAAHDEGEAPWRRLFFVLCLHFIWLLLFFK